MRKEYIQQKGYRVIEMWECKWWNLYRTDATVKNHLRANFPYQRSLSEERLMQEIKCGKLFGYVQCDLKVPEHLRAYFANFPPIFKNYVVGRNDIGDLMKEYAEKERIMSQPRRMLISCFHLNNRTIITPLLLFYLHLGLECSKFINSFSILPRSVSIPLYSLPSMLEEKKIEIPTQAALWLKQWSFKLTAPTDTTSWIVVDTLWQSIWTTKRHTVQLMRNFVLV